MDKLVCCTCQTSGEMADRENTPGAKLLFWVSGDDIMCGPCIRDLMVKAGLWAAEGNGNGSDVSFMRRPKRAKIRSATAEIQNRSPADPDAESHRRLLAFFLKPTPAETVRAVWPGEDD